MLQEATPAKELVGTLLFLRHPSHKLQLQLHNCNKTFAKRNLDLSATHSAAHEQKALLVL